MVWPNEDYLKLPGSYLFSTVARKQREFSAAHPDAKIIRLSIGDVTSLIGLILTGNLTGNPIADVNGDGIVNISDVTALINKLLVQ